METTKCTDASEDSDDPSKVQAPSFTYKDVISVKSCIQAAGWKFNIKEEDNPQFAEDQVISQFPTEGTAVVPGNQTFELTVATGDPGQ
jgi:beta-lactam-binding protein with PASTA domain